MDRQHQSWFTVSRSYDYSDAVGDMQKAVEIVGDVPYVYFNLANLQCL